MVSIVNRLMNSVHEIEISALVERCRQGDNEALSILYTKLYPKLVATAQHYVDRDTARDVVHDSWLIALASLSSLRNAHQIEAWITRIVRNVAINHIKHARLTQTQPLETVQETIADSQPDEPLIPLNALMCMVKQLPNGYEQVFRLRTFEGLSHDEISNRLGITSSTSRSQYTHARRLLRAMVQHWWMVPFTIIIAVISFIALYRPDRHAALDKPVMPKTAEKHNTILPDSSNCKNNQSQAGTSLHIAEHEASPDDVSSSRPALNIADSIACDQRADTTKHPNETYEQVAPHQVLPQISIAQTSTQKPPHNNTEWQSGTHMSLGLAFSGSPNGNGNAYPATITAIPSLSPTDGTSSTPAEFDNWTQYSQFIEEEANANPTDENLSLRQISRSNVLGNPQQEIEEHAHHDIPFTVSLSFNKTITQRWSVGSGLNYSRLHSTFDMGYSQALIRNEQTIHYLGIPVNASYTLFQRGRWSLFATAGTTLDIPVASSWRTEHLLNGQTIYSRPGSLTVPIQWSVNAGMGLQFNITPHIGIYAQPGVTYYFDNGTKTIRAEHPWNVTMPIGIKLTW